jgi:hypothetical protein
MFQSRAGQPVEPSLFGWTRNFCSQDGALTAEAGDSTRHAMKQPNPFWTLETPMANFVGLYTNVPEGGEVQDDQRAWLVGELKHAARDTSKALFLCLHHPVFSADTFHSGSPAMKELLDAVVQESGAHPDIVFTAQSTTISALPARQAVNNSLILSPEPAAIGACTPWPKSWVQRSPRLFGSRMTPRLRWRIMSSKSRAI